MKKKIIVHYKLSKYLPVSENWIYSQIKYIKNYVPIVYTYGLENVNEFPIKKIRVLILKSGVCDTINKLSKRLFNFYPYWLFYLMKDKPSLVHAHYGPSGYDFLPYKRILKIPLITRFYGFDISKLPKEKLWEEKYKKLFAEGELFLVEGSYMKKSLLELGCPEEKIVVHRLGIDIKKIKFVKRDFSSNVRILICGRFTEKKGIPYAIEAINIVKEKYKNIKLTIIGDAGNNKEKEKILSLIEKYKLQKYISLMGAQSYSAFLKELYNHHIFIAPSITASDGDKEGGAPVSLIEASASGMPVVSTFHCDIPEVVINNETGYLVPEKDVYTLAEKLEFLIFHPNLWGEFGKRGRAHIEKNYNIETQIKHLEKIYDKVVF